MRRRLRDNRVIAVVLGLIAFGVYLRTLAPSITYGDSPELTTAAYQLGVPHPTGYPLYMLICHLFIVAIPVGEVAYRTNLVSAVFGAASVSMVYLLGTRIIRSRPASAVASLLFGFGLTFWSQAVVTEVYTLHVFLITSVMFCLIEWDRKGTRKWLLRAAFLYGLSFTHHLSSILSAPAVLYWLLSSSRRWKALREWKRIVPLFLLPLLLYLYLPWAALRDPPMNWGDPRTLTRFWEHLTGAQYQREMGVHSLVELWRNFRHYFGNPIEDVNPGYLLSEFNLAVIWLAPIGLWDLWRRRRRFFWTTVLLYGAVVGWALNYHIIDVEVYYLLSHLIVALLIGCGIRTLIALARRVWKLKAPTYHSRRMAVGWMVGASLLLPALMLQGNWISDDMRGNTSAEIMGKTTLGFAKPDAILIGSGGEHTFPTLYAHYVEMMRSDVEIVYLQDLLIKDHLRLAERHRAEGIVVDPPPGFDRRPAGLQYEFSFARKFIYENAGKRPIYLLGWSQALIDGLNAGTTGIHAQQVQLMTIPMLEVTSTGPRELPVSRASRLN